MQNNSLQLTGTKDIAAHKNSKKRGKRCKNHPLQEKTGDSHYADCPHCPPRPAQPERLFAAHRRPLSADRRHCRDFHRSLRSVVRGAGAFPFGRLKAKLGPFTSPIGRGRRAQARGYGASGCFEGKYEPAVTRPTGRSPLIPVPNGEREPPRPTASKFLTRSVQFERNCARDFYGRSRRCDAGTEPASELCVARRPGSPRQVEDAH